MIKSYKEKIYNLFIFALQGFRVHALNPLFSVVDKNNYIDVTTIILDVPLHYFNITEYKMYILINNISNSNGENGYCWVLYILFIVDIKPYLIESVFEAIKCLI